MKMKSNLYTVICLVCFFFLISVLSGCQSKTVVKKLTNQNVAGNALERPKDRKTHTDKLEGVVYRLPRTVVLVTIPIKKVTKQPGVFKEFAPCFFSKDEVEGSIQETTVKYSIEKPDFTTRGEPDPLETYVVKTKGNYFEAKTVFVEYTASGLLSKGEMESTNNSLDFTLKTIGIVSGLAVDITKSLSGVGISRTTSVVEPSGVKRYGLPDLDCAKKGFNRSKILAENKIQQLKTAAPNLGAIATSAVANSCLNRARGVAGAACPFAAVPGDVANLEKLNELIFEKETLHEKIQYIDRSTDIERKKAAISEKANYEGQLASRNKSEIGPIQSRIRSLGAQIAALGNPEAGVDANLGKEVEDDYARAAALFIKIESLQGRRDNLVSTAANIPPETFKEMIDRTEATIADYRSVFLGGSDERIWTGILEFVPNVTPNQPLMKYANEHGICTTGTLLEAQKIRVNPQFLNKDTAANPCDRTLSVLVSSDANDSNFARNVELASQPDRPYQSSGWYYRIPSLGHAELTETQGANVSTIGFGKLTIAQFGKIVSVPAKTAGKTSTSGIVLDEATGALKNFKMSSTPLLDESTLKEAQGAVQTIVDASDPVTKRKRELELLQLQNQINEERKKLNSPQPSPTP